MTPVRHPQMTPPSPAASLVRLFAGGETALEGEAGKELPAGLVSLDGERAVATVPRLAVTCETRLFGRLLDETGEPWRVTLAVDRADYHSQELAAVQLRVTSVERDQTRRRAQRVPAGGRAWLEAVSCQEVVDGDRVDGTMVDLSSSGVAFATSRVLRRGDRLHFHGRFFADTITAEVRVMVVRPGATAGRTIVGCSFIAIDGENRVRLERVLGNAPARRDSGVDVASIRGLVAERPAGWRRMFRRS